MNSDNGEVSNTFEVYTYPEPCSIMVVPAKSGLAARSVVIEPMEVGGAVTRTVVFDEAGPRVKREPVDVAALVTDRGRSDADLMRDSTAEERAFVAALGEELEEASGVYKEQLKAQIEESKGRIEELERMADMLEEAESSLANLAELLPDRP